MMRESAKLAASKNGKQGTAGDGASNGLVPSRRQYLELKALHPEAILLYRLGDFYESFDDDAHIVARDARITLTSRSFGRSGRVPMAGIPYHALNSYLGRLLAAGHSVAIAEQLSEPGRGLVERAVTRVLTPGTIAETALLPATENRYLAAVFPYYERLGLAWVDVSTGEYATIELAGPDATRQLDDELTRLNPAECLVPDTGADSIEARSLTGHLTRLEHWHFEPNRASTSLCRHFGVRSLAPYDCAELPAAIGAAGAILAYLTRTNQALLPLLTGLRTEAIGTRVGLDGATRRNLELTRSLRTRGSRGSLLEVLDHTRTPMGTRALRRFIGQPLRDLAVLERRQAIVAALVGDGFARAKLGELIAQVGDLERLTSRITQERATIRDFVHLRDSLGVLPELVASLAATGAPALTLISQTIDECAPLLNLLTSAVTTQGEQARIRPGFSPELDRIVQQARETRRWLTDLERCEREQTGIRSLKIGFNKVFGYYIEVTRPNVSLVPNHYVRKQTVATGERYVTAPLKEAEALLLAADDEIAQLEGEALARLASEVIASAARLLATAGGIAQLDALRSLAETAAQANWAAPELDETTHLVIRGGRHPVVEVSLAGETFMPNDCQLGGAGPLALVVTGPNMGGKSTYLRQVALIVLLAQIGSFVPATSARIGLVDRIFSRIGAHDDLPGGASTFMVEMVETATILHQATRRSLVILDEVGRGTGTADGLAIARAVLEDLQWRIGARTLFATHYLELTALAEELPAVANVHVAALERDGRVIFLYAVRPGAADRAYGIHVARLAGLPSWVADRAASALASQTANGPAETATSVSIPDPVVRQVAESAGPPYQLALTGFPVDLSPRERLARELRELDLDRLTPREAIDWLFEQQSRLGGGA